jgi:glycosyltransferase involved in cell wall biosynthesis
VIIANHLWHERLVERSVVAEKCSVVLNHVDDEIFHPRQRTRDDGKVVIIFPGSFQWHQGLDIAVRALARVRERVPGAELHLYGGGGGARAKSDLLRLAEELGLDGSVKFPGSVRLHDIPVVVANADVGIVPKRADSFGNEAYSTKIMEFMSQGIPVVASRTKIDEYYFDEKEVRFFPSGDSEAMAAAIVEVLEDGALRERLVKAGREYVERNSWRLKKGEYLELVDRLTTESFKGVGSRDWRSTKSIR